MSEDEQKLKDVWNLWKTKNMIDYKERTTIRKKLHNLEKVHGVEILLAVESGSRMWGFESPDSDYDIRFIYKRPISWYFSILERRDVIEATDGIFDLSGWDLKKALFQIYKGNPCIMEWFNSPVEYIEGFGFFKTRTSEMLKKYFNPRTSIYHYLHMAQGNWKDYILNKGIVSLEKYLYVIRALLCCSYIESNSCFAPANIEELIKQAPLPTTVITAINLLIFEKKESFEKSVLREIENGKFLIDSLNNWIVEKIEHFKKSARLMGKVTSSPDDLDDFFMNNIFSYTDFS